MTRCVNRTAADPLFARSGLSCLDVKQYTSDMSIVCQSVIVAAPGIVRLESAELPPLAADEVLIRTTKTLISPGTERALLLNLPGLAVEYPKATGYSHVGEVIEVGSAVDGLTVGDRVASRSRHASQVIAKADNCHKLDANINDEEATFFQLLAISLQAVRKTRLEVGEAAAVIGAGLVGLLALQVCRAAGALPAIAIDSDCGRLKRAERLGADKTLLANQAAEFAQSKSALSPGVPVVIEATGNPAALETACQIAAVGGRLALLGSSRGATESFDFYKLVAQARAHAHWRPYQHHLSACRRARLVDAARRTANRASPDPEQARRRPALDHASILLSRY